MPKAKGGKSAQSADIEQAARRLAEPLINNAGFSLWDVVFEKEGAMWYLRILFDKDGGITTDECEAMTGPLNALMDAQGFIGMVDILEVGSPGLTKKLRLPEHFRACVGQSVRVQIKDKNGKTITKSGTLDDYSEEENQITLSGESINLRKTIKINLDLQFGGTKE